MKITTDKRVVQTGAFTVRKGEIAEVPDHIAKHWLAEKFARVPTPEELAALKAKPAKV